MPRTRKESPTTGSLQDESGVFPEKIDELKEAIECVQQELSVLRDVLDEIRELLGWAMNNADRFSFTSPFVPLTSMPRDPLAPDFGERINRLSGKDLPEEATSNHAPPETLSGQRELW